MAFYIIRDMDMGTRLLPLWSDFDTSSRPRP